MFECIRRSYDDALYKSTFTLIYLTLLYRIHRFGKYRDRGFSAFLAWVGDDIIISTKEKLAWNSIGLIMVYLIWQQQLE